MDEAVQGCLRRNTAEGGCATGPRRVAFGALIAAFLCAGGCAAPDRGPVVIFLDGAGWYSGGGSVNEGLRKAGYKGAFETFTWSSFLGPAQDHLVSARSKLNAERLANQIEAIRGKDANGAIHLIGLSAGTAVILSALETLKDGVEVDNVVLLSSTASAERNLNKIMQHVRRNLYATCSPHDGFSASLAVNADGLSGPPVGRQGFKAPRTASPGSREAYSRVINLPWQPSYVGFGWTGSHTSVTDSDFIASVIGPRLLTKDPYPLDRPVTQRLTAEGRP